MVSSSARASGSAVPTAAAACAVEPTLTLWVTCKTGPRQLSRGGTQAQRQGVCKSVSFVIEPTSTSPPPDATMAAAAKEHGTNFATSAAAAPVLKLRCSEGCRAAQPARPQKSCLKKVSQAALGGARTPPASWDELAVHTIKRNRTVATADYPAAAPADVLWDPREDSRRRTAAAAAAFDAASTTCWGAAAGCSCDTCYASD
jgi:hypothetical protein